VVEVPVPDAVLVLALDRINDNGRSNNDNGRSNSDSGQNTVEFRCPNCSLRGSQRVGERATRLLSEAGMQVAVPEHHDRQVPASDAARGGPEPDPR